MRAYGVIRDCRCYDCRHDSKNLRKKYKHRARQLNKKFIQQERAYYEEWFNH